MKVIALLEKPSESGIFRAVGFTQQRMPKTVGKQLSIKQIPQSIYIFSIYIKKCL